MVRGCFFFFCWGAAWVVKIARTSRYFRTGTREQAVNWKFHKFHELVNQARSVCLYSYLIFGLLLFGKLMFNGICHWHRESLDITGNPHDTEKGCTTVGLKGIWKDFVNKLLSNLGVHNRFFSVGFVSQLDFSGWYDQPYKMYPNQWAVLITTWFYLLT